MTTFDDTRNDLILDGNFIPVDPGIRFSASLANPNFTKEFITLADGLLLDVKWDRTYSRERFIAIGHTSSYKLDAIRCRTLRTLPHRDELRRLPHAEQYPLLDVVNDYLNTADRFVASSSSSDEAVIDTREEEPNKYGDVVWRVPRRNHVGAEASEDHVLMPAFDLWDVGYMPQWDDEPPAWPLAG